MTANAFEEDKQRAFDAGMNDHISKPISVNALLAALRKNLKFRKDNTMRKDKRTELWRVVKFVLFSASAGVIQIGLFTALNELCRWSYWPCYLIALVASVVWNFTFNRKFTFKSAANVPVAMLKVFAFYLVFTPISTLLGNYFTAKFADVSAINYIVLGLTMATNMITEFLYDKFVVFRGQENTAVSKKDKKKA